MFDNFQFIGYFILAIFPLIFIFCGFSVVDDYFSKK